MWLQMTKQAIFCMGSGCGHKYDKTSNFIAWEVGVVINMTKQAILLHGKWVWSQIRSDKNAPEPQCHPSAFCECIYTHSFLGTLWPQRFKKREKSLKKYKRALSLSATILRCKTMGLPSNMAELEEIFVP